MIRALCMTCVFQLACAVALPTAVYSETKPTMKKDKVVNREWGKAVYGQAISIVTEKTVYAPEEAIVLDVMLKNVGQSDVRIIDMAPLDAYRITVLLSNGKKAFLTLFGKTAFENCGDGSKCTLMLKTGEHRRVRFAISRLFDFSLAGKYTVFVQRGLLQGAKDTSFAEATSNKIEITVDDSLGKPAQEYLGGRLGSQPD